MKVGLVTATVEDTAGVVEVTRSKERALLCLVALTPGRIVSVDRLIDGLWGDAPPRTAAKTLQTYVKNLRSRLAQAGAARDTLRTEPPGYLLAVDADDVDVLRFEHMADDARRAFTVGNLDGAFDQFSRALEIVSAADLLAFDGPGLEPALVRILERRRRALDDLVDVQLQRGHHLDVIAPLSERLDVEPQNERGWAQLMTALYRADRQRDALQAFTVARDRLASEFGLSPGPALVELEQQILHHEVSEIDSDAPDPVHSALVVAVRVLRGSAADADALIDRVLEPGGCMDRYSVDDRHQVIVPDLDTAVRVASRVRMQGGDLRVAVTRDGDPGAADFVTAVFCGDQRVVFAPVIGALLADRRWTRTNHGWSPPASRSTVRMPPALEALTARSPVHIPRRLEAALTPHLDRVLHGDVRTMQLSGIGGIGKSSLLADLAAEAHQRGHATLYARAEAGQPADQRPIAELAYQTLLLVDRSELDHHVALHGHVLASLLPELATRTGSTTVAPAASSPAEVEAALVDLFQRLARNVSVVLLVDDAPLLTDDAVRILRRLMTDPRTVAIGLVLACRTGDPGTPALAPELGDLVSADTTFELPPFTTDQTARFLESAASIERSPRTRQVAELVHRAARGLPLFVREIAHDMVASNEWLTVDGKWRIDRNADQMALPTSLNDLLGRRLEQLEVAAQELSSIGAVFGEFATLLVATVSELPVADVLRSLDELIEQRVVEAIPGLADHYRFAHPLLREAALARIGPGRQSAIALAAAEILSARQNPSESQLDRRAELWFRALPLAPVDRVEHELMLASEAATGRGDHGRAMLHLRRIIQMNESARQQPSVSIRVALAEAAVHAQTEAGVRRTYARGAFDAAHAIPDAQLCARAALAFAGPFNPFGSLVAVDDEGESMARQTLELDIDDLSLRAQLWGMLAAARSDVSGAAPEAELALDHAERCGDPLVMGRMLSLSHAIQSAAKPVGVRLRADEHIVEIAQTHNDRHLEMQGWGWVAAHALEAGEIDRLDLAAARRLDLAERLDDTIYQWSNHVYQGMRHMVAGRFDQAEVSLWRALEVGRLPLADHANRFFGLQLLKLSEMRGDGAALLDTTEAFASRLDYVTAYVSHAHLCVETGDQDRAAAIVAAKVPTDLGELPDTYDRLPTLALLARIAQRTGDARLATEVHRHLRESQGQLCVHADAVLYGSAHHNLGRCLLTMGDGVAATAQFDASLAVYEALGANAWLLLLEADRCAALTMTGEPVRAAAAWTELAAKSQTMGLALAPQGPM